MRSSFKPGIANSDVINMTIRIALLAMEVNDYVDDQLDATQQ